MIKTGIRYIITPIKDHEETDFEVIKYGMTCSFNKTELLSQSLKLNVFTKDHNNFIKYIGNLYIPAKEFIRNDKTISKTMYQLSESAYNFNVEKAKVLLHLENWITNKGFIPFQRSEVIVYVGK